MKVWPSCIATFTHFLKHLSSSMISTVANLRLLKKIMRGAFSECKRYFVYMEVTGKCLIGLILEFTNSFTISTKKKLESSLHTGIRIKDKCCKSIALTQLSEEINSSCGQAFEDHKMAGCNSCGKHSKVFYFISQWRRLRKNRRTFRKTTLKASCLQNEQVHFILTTLCSPPNLMPVVKHSYTV